MFQREQLVLLHTGIPNPPHPVPLCLWNIVQLWNVRHSPFAPASEYVKWLFWGSNEILSRKALCLSLFRIQCYSNASFNSLQCIKCLINELFHIVLLDECMVQIVFHFLRVNYPDVQKQRGHAWRIRSGRRPTCNTYSQQVTQIGGFLAKIYFVQIFYSRTDF